MLAARGRSAEDVAWDGLGTVWGPAVPVGRAPRILGVFAHPDDEVFCAGGTLARAAETGAVTALLSLTQGETGHIRDATVATRRTLGRVRAGELVGAAEALGVDQASCLDLGDGRLAQRPLAEVAAAVRAAIERVEPDAVVTFGPDGAFGHPDHITSSLATIVAIRALPEGVRPRLLHARFPQRDELLVDAIVDWLTSKDQRFSGTAAFAHALKLFADGSSMLGLAADHLRVEWFPAGSFIIEQDEPATELFCILSGSVDIVVEGDDGRFSKRVTTGAGCFVGEDGLASGRRRNAHAIAREDVTCLVLSAQPPNQSAGRGAGADAPHAPAPAPGPAVDDGSFSVDVRSALDRKIAALVAHRSQYALDANLLPRSVLECALGTEYFTVVDVDDPRWS